ncbi:MAG: hypothetical protein R3B06_22755 [Kofleriaceae bacterium]
MRPTLLRLLAVVVVAFGMFGVHTASAQPDPMVAARAHYQAGMAKFNAAQYDEAVAEFRAAEAIAPSPVNDYNIGLALDRKGDAAAATAAYRAYLNRVPNATNRPEVEASIARLAPAVAAAQAAADAAQAAAAQAAADQAAADQAAAAATRPAAPMPTGDAKLDRVAAVDLNAMRTAAPLPAPTTAAAGQPVAGAPTAPAREPKKASRPFYKSPVFWVLAAVGVYVVVVLADNSSQQNQPLAGRLLLPDTSPRMSGGATVLSF